MPWIIRKLGWFISILTRQPKFESFFAVEMMFLGNTEALAVSGLQIKANSEERNLTLAMLSMNCVSAAIVGAYTQMVPGQFVLTAIPVKYYQRNYYFEYFKPGNCNRRRRYHY